MAAKYHIGDNGMPGKCDASSPDRCPKTQAGDAFHGTLEEATAEAQSRFERELGAFATTSKAADAKEAADAVKTNGEEIYRHPQGKIIKIDADGNVKAYKNGRELSTSATAEKLRAGYGAWKRDDASAAELPAQAGQNGLSEAQKEAIVDSYDGAVLDRHVARAALDQIIKDQAEYDKLHAEAEGRLSYTDYSKGYSQREEKIGRNPDPRGYTKTTPLPEQKKLREAAFAKWRSAVERAEAQQTAVEEAGLGHRIPDQGNTIRVRTQAQKVLLKEELLGQISDGKWENTANNPWQDWSNATVIVDAQNPGRNFFTTKDNYQLNARDLLDVVGDRMQQSVRDKTGNDSYDEKAMGKDLSDLRKIFKTHRDQVSGD